MAMVPDTMSPAKRAAAKSRRRLIPFAASAPRRAPPRSPNGSPPGGDNVRATRASTFDMNHHPFDDWTKGLLASLFRRDSRAGHTLFDRGCGRRLLRDPVVGRNNSLAQCHLRLPLQHRAQPRIVTVATAHSLRLGEIVHERDLLLRYPDHDFGKLVNADQFIRAEVERLSMIRSHDAMNALDAVVDIHERAGLLAIAPYFDLAWIWGECDLAAHRRRRLFTAAVIGAQRAIYVVEAHDARGEAVVFHIILAEFLRVELLEAITFFRLRRKRVLLAQRRDIWGGLQAVRIDAGGG